ncbi:MAG: DUF5668 domain-containing protein [Caldisericia bacterium]|nr:DUF5668 domain-containing protein [Caldisericia bacterium]
MFGLILVALGVLFLLKNLGIISGDVWEIFWPILLIILGLWIIIGSFTKRKFFRNFFSCRRDFHEDFPFEKKDKEEE